MLFPPVWGLAHGPCCCPRGPLVSAAAAAMTALVMASMSGMLTSGFDIIHYIHFDRYEKGVSLLVWVCALNMYYS